MASCHRLHPHAGRWRFHLRMLNDGSKISSPSCGVQAFTISVTDLSLTSFMMAESCFFARPLLVCTENDPVCRATIDCTAPIFERLIVIIHVLEFKQVADGPRDDDVIAVPVCIGFFQRQDVGKVLGNAGFLSNDDDGHMEKAHRRPYLNPPS